jgi:hypothetical protein
MPNANPTFEGGVCTIRTDTAWLNNDGDLPVCLAQPTLVNAAVVSDDGPRPESLALANAIFADENGQRRISRWFSGQNGLLLFPEYAFSSGDFRALNDLIAVHPHPLIVIAGFGAVSGANLLELLESCTATWATGAANVDAQNRYNAAWCWIHHGPADTACYIVLKNFFEQQVEIALVNGLTPGDHILQLETRDLVLFPIICSDLVCEQPTSARARITRQLQNVAANGRRVLVTAPLYTNKPESNHWLGVINNIVSLDNRRAGLIFVNQLAAKPFLNPADDKWRDLTGGFVHRHVMANPPSEPLPAVRYVSTNEASGLLLRQSVVGVAFGPFKWVNAAELGRVWVPQHRALEPADFRLLNESVASQEFRRYVARRADLISGSYHESAKPLLRSGLDSIKSDVNDRHLSPRLFPGLLSGVDKQGSKLSPDLIDDQTQHLDRALAVFAAVEKSSGGAPIVADHLHGQIRYQDMEVLVWKSPIYDAQKMCQILKDLSVDHPNDPQLLVIGDGRAGYCPASPIKPNWAVDYSDRPQEGHFTSVRSRHIFWRPLVEVENRLADPATTAVQKEEAILTQVAIA